MESGASSDVQLGAVLADDVVVALAQLLADRRQLLAQQVLALLLVDALGDVVADRLGHLQLGEVVLGPGQHELDTLGDVDGGQRVAPAVLVELGPRHDGVGQRARLGTAAQQLGQAARATQLGDRLEGRPQLAGQRLDARGRARVGEQLGVGERRPALGVVDGGHPRPLVDPDHGHRLAVGQRADVGDLGDDAEVAAGGAQQEAAAGRLPRRVDGTTQGVGVDGEGDDGARQHGRRQVGEGQADGLGRR